MSRQSVSLKTLVQIMHYQMAGIEQPVERVAHDAWEMICYYDEEWGVPVYDDRKQFEFLNEAHANGPHRNSDLFANAKISSTDFWLSAL